MTHYTHYTHYTLLERLFFTPSLLIKHNYISKSFTIPKFTGKFEWKYVESKENMWHPYYRSTILLKNKDNNDTYLEKIEIHSIDSSTIHTILSNRKFKNNELIYKFDIEIPNYFIPL